MTTFVTWQLIVTLDSIRNSCDVSYKYFNEVGCKRTWKNLLPLAQAKHPAEHSPGVDSNLDGNDHQNLLTSETHPHVEINVGGVDDGGDGVDHVEPHLHRVPGVISTSLWQAWHAVVAVAKDLDP